MLIFLIVLLLFLTPLCASYKVPSNPPSVLLPQTSLSQSDSSIIQEKQSSTKVITRTESHYLSSPSSSGDSITVRKNLLPNNKDYYLPNKVYCMEVEVKGTKWEASNIIIREEVDPWLRIVNISKINLYDPFTNSCDFVNSKDYFLRDNIIFLKIDSLKPNERIKFCYNIISNKTGLFDSNTIIRLGNSSTVTDLDYSKEILIGSPQFDVNIDLDRLHVFDDIDPLRITYNILYKSSSLDPIFCNISLENSYSDEYEIYLANSSKPYDGHPILMNLNPTNHTSLSTNIVFKHPGPHRIPGLQIEGRTYSFDLTISVSHWILYWGGEILPLISILAIALGIYFTRKDLHYMHEQLLAAQKQMGSMQEEVKIILEDKTKK